MCLPACYVWYEHLVIKIKGACLSKTMTRWKERKQLQASHLESAAVDQEDGFRPSMNEMWTIWRGLWLRQNRAVEDLNYPGSLTWRTSTVKMWNLLDPWAVWEEVRAALLRAHTEGSVVELGATCTKCYRTKWNEAGFSLIHWHREKQEVTLIII